MTPRMSTRTIRRVPARTFFFEADVGDVPVNPCATFPQGYLVPAGVSASGCLAWAMYAADGGRLTALAWRRRLGLWCRP